VTISDREDINSADGIALYYFPSYQESHRLHTKHTFIYDQVTSQVQNCIYNQSKKYPDTPIFFDLRRPNQAPLVVFKKKDVES
jgi:hypothetical protein